ncbi:hypothetical protein QBC35DRAFT_241919 [Podospora australis]|uniref:MARVEL domain-containing protein n=1 Tax=Podospora australis TaxID=1536484 RepID=A0AAN6X2I7_9PEZI|nr:hypothetical protein QBC35DRAFT_241919 [Podospora australis]
MIFGMLFAFWRFMEIITLVPIMGMLSWFVHQYLESNQLTPAYILLLFIVSVLALAWAVFTLFSYHRSSANARFVGLVDLAFVGALIAGVYYLRFIAKADCSSLTRTDRSYEVHFADFGKVTASGWQYSVDKTCAMLKACFAMGIMNVVFFFITAIMAWVHGGHVAKDEKVRYVQTRRTSHSRHGSRSRRRSGSAGHSRRSSHSHSRVYV